MSPKVSVIIPVYNAEKYLDECLDSILKQSFTDYEVLLINDGSTDCSGKICDRYATTDKRITVIHKKNGGVSSARNVGIERSKGEWITFVDSDDYIGANYFQELEVNLEPHIDWILLNIERVKGKEIESLLSFENENHTLTSFLDNFTLYPHFPGPWGKFFKCKIIRENNIQFDRNLHFGEDAVFNLEYVKCAANIKLSNKSAYYYIDTQDGLSYSKYHMQMDKYFYDRVHKGLKELDEGIYNKNIIIPLSRFYFSVLHSNVSFSEKKNQILKLRSDSKDNLLGVLGRDTINLKLHYILLKLEFVSLLIFIVELNQNLKRARIKNKLSFLSFPLSL